MPPDFGQIFKIGLVQVSQFIGFLKTQKHFNMNLTLTTQFANQPERLKLVNIRRP